MCAVAKKRKKKVFQAVQAVKALARERIGAPPRPRGSRQKEEDQGAKTQTKLGELLGDI